MFWNIYNTFSTFNVSECIFQSALEKDSLDESDSLFREIDFEGGGAHLSDEKIY